MQAALDPRPHPRAREREGHASPDLRRRRRRVRRLHARARGRRNLCASRIRSSARSASSPPASASKTCCDKIGVERRVHTSGERKAMLDPFKPEDPRDAAHLEALQREVHESFKAMVRDRRQGKLKADEKELFSGAFWTGAKAKEFGLIDDLGDMRSVCRSKFGDKVEFRVITPRRSWFGLDMFSSPRRIRTARRLGGQPHRRRRRAFFVVPLWAISPRHGSDLDFDSAGHRRARLLRHQGPHGAPARRVRTSTPPRHPSARSRASPPKTWSSAPPAAPTPRRRKPRTAARRSVRTSEASIEPLRSSPASGEGAVAKRWWRPTASTLEAPPSRRWARRLDPPDHGL